MTLIREPVWAYVRQHCNSFATMSADAVFSDIIRLSTVGVTTQERGITQFAHCATMKS